MIYSYYNNGVPLESVWADIDYMIDGEDFTYD